MSEPSELAQFLRARREQLRPADVGLPDNGRRRTPGLRREEVATLAGVSIDYLIRLEQGRDLNPSASVIVALAKALRLTEEERAHLGHLSSVHTKAELCPNGPAATEVAPTIQALLDRLDPTPAFVVGHTDDVLAWNEPWHRLAAPAGLLDDSPPNLARYLFLHPNASMAYPDWTAAADEQVRQLRSAAPRWGSDAAFAALVEELSAEAEFARRWSAHTVAPRRRGTREVRHPGAGVLRFDYEVLLLPDDTEQRLVTWLAADDATAAALEPPVTRLRAVTTG